MTTLAHPTAPSTLRLLERRHALSMAAIAADLATLRPDEPRLPRYRDPTRPVSTARLGPAGRQAARHG